MEDTNKQKTEKHSHESRSGSSEDGSSHPEVGMGGGVRWGWWMGWLSVGKCERGLLPKGTRDKAEEMETIKYVGCRLKKVKKQFTEFMLCGCVEAV